MRRSVVEGEPGIFPAPVAQLLTRLNRWVRRRLSKGTDAPPDQPRPSEDG